MQIALSLSGKLQSQGAEQLNTRELWEDSETLRQGRKICQPYMKISINVFF